MRHLLPLVLLCACASGPDVEALSAEASAQGPWAVGHTTVTLTREAIASDAAREVPVEIWYPAAEGASGPSATYTVAGIAQVEAPHALASADAAEGPFPVAVYSHGSGGIGLLAYPYAERLASHGWLVVAPDHTGNTSLDLVFGGGDPFGRIALDRPGDIRAVLDAVEDGLGDGLDGLGDTSSVLLFGHSFGGYTTLSVGGGVLDLSLLDDACGPSSEDPTCVLYRDPDVQEAFASELIDPRIDALAPQAPALVQAFEADTLSGLDLPVLLMSAKGDITTPDEDEAKPLWDLLDGEHDRWLRVPEGGHYSFISICDDVGVELIESFQPGATRDGCGPDFTPTTELLPAFATWLLAFGRAHVLGEEGWDEVLDLPHSGAVNQRTRSE